MITISLIYTIILILPLQAVDQARGNVMIRSVYLKLTGVTNTHIVTTSLMKPTVYLVSVCLCVYYLQYLKQNNKASLCKSIRCTRFNYQQVCVNDFHFWLNIAYQFYNNHDEVEIANEMSTCYVKLTNIF